jgi:hypothetical protein
MDEQGFSPLSFETTLTRLLRMRPIRGTSMTMGKDTILLTVFLKHQKDKNLDQIREKLVDRGFWKRFPTESCEVVSWYVMMGIGQVATLRVPADKLRDVNMAIEQCAWGAFDTEFDPTYDFQLVWQDIKSKVK